MKTIQVRKGQLLQHPEESNSKVFKVQSGLLRSYTIDEKGKEHIFMFASEGFTITDHLPPTRPTNFFIDALEDSTIEVIEKTIIDTQKDIKGKIAHIDLLQKRIIMLMSVSIIERYNHFINRYPQIVERIPQKMIASYLGITPEALSKAKRKHKSNKIYT